MSLKYEPASKSLHISVCGVMGDGGGWFVLLARRVSGYLRDRLPDFICKHL